jgi:hypothetical protein
MALRLFGYWTGSPSRIDWHAIAPWWIADGIANIECEIGWILSSLARFRFTGRSRDLHRAAGTHWMIHFDWRPGIGDPDFAGTGY